mmetsp:Transcript_4035/g.9460  ORF Transcript_4035/g.9460 Transcript_4035/m.9460 type:complete len:127 (-) Transcript_4035:60-440(-)|eukprot:CAMPEP_0170607942 /NCGR_PEP_ID=MMETSP0224-20130122/21321_1 /TAXON_ID=285029 /ORGANISM="Togula jolla, Strain CCCM 725" /LENGTH=126 /DNA_ID=CAMNT_0010933137 /DNA_START=18 /DNA_END=398 /DNA_ORIENTATION=-
MAGATLPSDASRRAWDAACAAARANTQQELGVALDASKRALRSNSKPSRPARKEPHGPRTEIAVIEEKMKASTAETHDGSNSTGMPVGAWYDDSDFEWEEEEEFQIVPCSGADAAEKDWVFFTKTV